jgi:predicted small lipoprotein YifL
MRAVLSLIVFAVSLSGCGYKGPLYHPKPKPAAQKPGPTPPATPDESRGEDAPRKE